MCRRLGLPCCTSRPSTTAPAATCSTRRWRIRWRPRRSRVYLAGSPGRWRCTIPDGIADALFALYPEAPPFAGLYRARRDRGGQRTRGHVARPLTELPRQRRAHRADRRVRCRAHRRAHRAPAAAGRRGGDAGAVRLPDAMLTNRARYLDKLNFATNFVFFRDADGLSTRLVSANYWAGYGARRDPAVAAAVRCRRHACWRPGSRRCQRGPGGFSIDSRAVRERFGLPRVHRPVVHPRDRRGRPRRGEIRARHLCATRQLGRQPVLHA